MYKTQVLSSYIGYKNFPMTKFRQQMSFSTPSLPFFFSFPLTTNSSKWVRLPEM